MKSLEKLDQQIAQAIIQACDEILDGNLRDQFIVDAIQGGAGTSANMNANEVIANRAIEILGGTKGDYSIVHPNDHVNMSQSTNDVIPTAGKITGEDTTALDAAIKALKDAIADENSTKSTPLSRPRTRSLQSSPSARRRPLRLWPRQRML